MRTLSVVPLAVLVLACGGGDAPVTLAWHYESTSAPSYAVSLTHEIDFSMGDHGSHGIRELEASYAILGDAASGGMVHLDTVRASMIWGNNRERIDTRHLAGASFPLHSDESPVIEMGGRNGGSIPVSHLIDYGFPTLPAEPVSAGSTWSESRNGMLVEGFLQVTADVTTTHRVRGRTTVEGRECVEVESTSTGTLSDGMMDGNAVPYAGTFAGTARWCFDPVSGSLVAMHGEEVTRGTSSAEDRPDMEISQKTTIAVQGRRNGDRG